DTNPGEGRIARSLLAVEVRLRHEAATDERLAPVIFILGQCGIGARDLNLGGKLRRVLRLYRAINGRQRLALAHPGSGVDQHGADHSALARDPDRLGAMGGQSAPSRAHPTPPGPAPADWLSAAWSPRRSIISAIRMAAMPTTAAIMMFRRRLERSTTIRVSEPCKRVSRFMRNILSPLSRFQQTLLQPLYYANKSPAAT